MNILYFYKFINLFIYLVFLKEIIKINDNAKFMRNYNNSNLKFKV